MVMLSIFGSVEFYVLMAVLAAAVVGLCVKPSSHGAVETLFVRGVLSLEPEYKEPGLDVEVLDDCSVRITRHGLDGLTDRCVVSLAITKNMFDISIVERTAEVSDGEPVNSATFILDFLGPEHYHILYRNEDTGLFTAFTLAVRPGLKITRELKR